VGDSGGRLSMIETADEGDIRRTSVVVWGIAVPRLDNLLLQLADRPDVIEISPPPPTG